MYELMNVKIGNERIHQHVTLIGERNSEDFGKWLTLHRSSVDGIVEQAVQLKFGFHYAEAWGPSRLLRLHKTLETAIIIIWLQDGYALFSLLLHLGSDDTISVSRTIWWYHSFLLPQALNCADHALSAWHLF